METPFLKFHYSHPRSQPFYTHRSSPPPNQHHRPNLQQQQQRLRHQKQQQQHGGSRSAMRHLATFQRISPNRIINFVNRSHFPKVMSDQTTKEKDQSIDASKSMMNNAKQEAEKPESIAPPPEKPLPGDCCGSGCVRCVWDVYYEELEEYNNLVKSKSEPISDSKTC